ncbi:MAG: cell division protein [Sporolactobacillus sp.]
MVNGLEALFGAVGWFFINPLLYMLLAGLAWFGACRVRAERREFRVKVYGMFNTVFTGLGPGLLVGLAGSLLIAAAGAALRPGVLVLLCVCYLLTMCSLQLRLLSPAIAGGIAAVLAFFCPIIQTPYSWLNGWLVDIHRIDFVSFGVFLTVAVLCEAGLVYFYGAKQSSPRLIPSRRGGRAGAYQIAQLWIMPLLVLVPSTAPLSHIGSWPFLLPSASTYGFVFLPVGAGLSGLITYALPKKAVRDIGSSLFAVAIVLAVGTTAAYFLRLPLLVVACAAAALLSRIAFVIYQAYLCRVRPFCLMPSVRGLRVIAVLSASPGERARVVAGEEITAVNDQKVASEDEFYQALQRQAAYCKLEIVDMNGEPRIVKLPIHEGDGHHIGLLFL